MALNNNQEYKQQFLSLKGLKGYTIFIVTLIIAFLYIQLNGIKLINTTDTEHEGNSHTYGSSHHK